MNGRKKPSQLAKTSAEHIIFDISDEFHRNSLSVEIISLHDYIHNLSNYRNNVNWKTLSTAVEDKYSKKWKRENTGFQFDFRR